MELHFTNLLIVVAAGFAAPFALGFLPALRLPSIVLELVLGIVLGPAVLGWVHVDDPVTVMSTIGLAVLLFLAGLEIEFHKLRGSVLRVTLLGFLLSFAIADFGAVILLSLLFSKDSSSTATKVILLVGLFVAAALVWAAIKGIEH